MSKSRPQYDEHGQPTAWGRWLYDNVQEPGGIHQHKQQILDAVVALSDSAFEAGRQSIIADMGDISRQLSEAAELTRAEQRKVAETENSTASVDDLARTPDVAKRYGVTLDTVRTWARRKEIPSMKSGGLRFKMDEVDHALQNRGKAPVEKRNETATQAQ